MSDARVEFEDDFWEPAVAGNEKYFGFRCPKHPTSRCNGLAIRGRTPGHRASWKWNGDRQAPTFSPSINCLSCPGKWHGYIENGRCVTTNKQDEPEPEAAK